MVEYIEWSRATLSQGGTTRKTGSTLERRKTCPQTRLQPKSSSKKNISKSQPTRKLSTDKSTTRNSSAETEVQTTNWSNFSRTICEFCASTAFGTTKHCTEAGRITHYPSSWPTIRSKLQIIIFEILAATPTRSSSRKDL